MEDVSFHFPLVGPCIHRVFLRFRFGDRKEILRDRLEEFERPFSIDVISGHYNLRDRFGPSKHLKKTLCIHIHTELWKGLILKPGPGPNQARADISFWSPMQTRKPRLPTELRYAQLRSNKRLCVRVQLRAHGLSHTKQLAPWPKHWQSVTNVAC